MILKPSIFASQVANQMMADFRFGQHETKTSRLLDIPFLL